MQYKLVKTRRHFLLLLKKVKVSDTYFIDFLLIFTNVCWSIDYFGFISDGFISF